MQNFTTKTIREIAVEMPVTTRVFEEFKIDYCCGGGRNFAVACQSAGVAPEVLSQKLNQVLSAQSQNNTETPVQKQSLSALIDYILEKHHIFTKQELIRLKPLMEKVASKHGPNHEELLPLQNYFNELYDDLMPHMMKEENVLFPFIKQLEMADLHNLSSPKPPFGTVKNPVRMMLLEHDKDGGILRKMRETSKDYKVPEGVCPSFQALYFGLEELEKDLHRHIHLENNVLFPDAVELEQKVMFVN
ncbi:MAG TPA: iron-sulfur cluster repair di-iron protein [Pyrinomonadaceae bacterium]|nr:iron-sulfur cluster repair di-iron protein [Pyrinomonadaceae bacterium]